VPKRTYLVIVFGAEFGAEVEKNILYEKNLD